MNEKSEQIDSRLNIGVDRDQPLSPRGVDQAVIAALSARQNVCAQLADVEFSNKLARCVVGESSEIGKHAFLTAAVTFLGGHGNHPIFKKRIQLKSWFKPAYNQLVKAGYTVHFLGVYHYNGNIVFVDFAPQSYLRRKMHNSSAFVYLNDLYRAMKDGVAIRVDLHGNIINTIRRDKLCEYLLDKRGKADTSELVNVFDAFNSKMPFGKWILGQDAIKDMYRAKWPKWKETEWPGWLLEYKFATFLKENNITNVVYQGNAGKKNGALDFDLLFPIHKFYGDLKASDIEKRDSPGNDQESLMTAIDRCDRFWYVIYEHETIKDKDCNNEVTRFRYEFLKSVGSEAKSPDSYARRMKNRVNFKRMMILELNRANCGELLSDFHQGHQPNGGARAVKVLINKRNVENYQVFHYAV